MADWDIFNDFKLKKPFGLCGVYINFSALYAPSQKWFPKLQKWGAMSQTMARKPEHCKQP